MHHSKSSGVPSHDRLHTAKQIESERQDADPAANLIERWLNSLRDGRRYQSWINAVLMGPRTGSEKQTGDFHLTQDCESQVALI